MLWIDLKECLRTKEGHRFSQLFRNMTIAITDSCRVTCHDDHRIAVRYGSDVVTHSVSVVATSVVVVIKLVGFIRDYVPRPIELDDAESFMLLPLPVRWIPFLAINVNVRSHLKFQRGFTLLTTTAKHLTV